MNEEIKNLVEEIKEKLKKLDINFEEIKDFTDLYKYASLVGEDISKVLLKGVDSMYLDDNIIEYSEAKEILHPTVKQGYKKVTEASANLQTIENKKSGLNIKGIEVKMNMNKMHGLITKLSEKEYKSARWVLDEPLKNYINCVVDDTIKANINLHHKLGFIPKVIRRENGACCDWCKSVAGEYEYPKVPKEVWKRHTHCDCIMEYYPSKKRKQDVWGKTWQEVDESAIIEKRKKIAQENPSEISDGRKQLKGSGGSVK